jgi:hypothetical protein
LIAIQDGIQLPFITFLTILAIPTIINLPVISGFIIVEALRFLGTIIADRGFSISVITITGAMILYTISKEQNRINKKY